MSAPPPESTTTIVVTPGILRPESLASRLLGSLVMTAPMILSSENPSHFTFVKGRFFPILRDHIVGAAKHYPNNAKNVESLQVTMLHSISLCFELSTGNCLDFCDNCWDLLLTLILDKSTDVSDKALCILERVIIRVGIRPKILKRLLRSLVGLNEEGTDGSETSFEWKEHAEKLIQTLARCLSAGPPLEVLHIGGVDSGIMITLDEELSLVGTGISFVGWFYWEGASSFGQTPQLFRIGSRGQRKDQSLLEFHLDGETGTLSFASTGANSPSSTNVRFPSAVWVMVSVAMRRDGSNDRGLLSIFMDQMLCWEGPVLLPKTVPAPIFLIGCSQRLDDATEEDPGCDTIHSLVTSIIILQEKVNLAKVKTIFAKGPGAPPPVASSLDQNIIAVCHPALFSKDTVCNGRTDTAVLLSGARSGVGPWILDSLKALGGWEAVTPLFYWAVKLPAPPVTVPTKASEQEALSRGRGLFPDVDTPSTTIEILPALVAFLAAGVNGQGPRGNRVSDAIRSNVVPVVEHILETCHPRHLSGALCSQLISLVRNTASRIKETIKSQNKNLLDFETLVLEKLLLNLRVWAHATEEVQEYLLKELRLEVMQRPSNFRQLIGLNGILDSVRACYWVAPVAPGPTHLKNVQIFPTPVPEERYLGGKIVGMRPAKRALARLRKMILNFVPTMLDNNVGDSEIESLLLFIASCPDPVLRSDVFQLTIQMLGPHASGWETTVGRLSSTKWPMMLVDFLAETDSDTRILALHLLVSILTDSPAKVEKEFAMMGGYSLLEIQLRDGTRAGACEEEIYLALIALLTRTPSHSRKIGDRLLEILATNTRHLGHRAPRRLDTTLVACPGAFDPLLRTLAAATATTRIKGLREIGQLMSVPANRDTFCSSFDTPASSRSPDVALPRQLWAQRLLRIATGEVDNSLAINELDTYETGLWSSLTSPSRFVQPDNLSRESEIRLDAQCVDLVDHILCLVVQHRMSARGGWVTVMEAMTAITEVDGLLMTMRTALRCAVLLSAVMGLRECAESCSSWVESEPLRENFSAIVYIAADHHLFFPHVTLDVFNSSTCLPVDDVASKTRSVPPSPTGSVSSQEMFLERRTATESLRVSRALFDQLELTAAELRRSQTSHSSQHTEDTTSQASDSMTPLVLVTPTRTSPPLPSPCRKHNSSPFPPPSRGSDTDRPRAFRPASVPGAKRPQLDLPDGGGASLSVEVPISPRVSPTPAAATTPASPLPGLQRNHSTNSLATIFTPHANSTTCISPMVFSPPAPHRSVSTEDTQRSNKVVESQLMGAKVKLRRDSKGRWLDLTLADALLCVFDKLVSFRPGKEVYSDETFVGGQMGKLKSLTQPFGVLWLVWRLSFAIVRESNGDSLREAQRACDRLSLSCLDGVDGPPHSPSTAITPPPEAPMNIKRTLAMLLAKCGYDGLQSILSNSPLPSGRDSSFVFFGRPSSQLSVPRKDRTEFVSIALAAIRSILHRFPKIKEMIHEENAPEDCRALTGVLQLQSKGILRSWTTRKFQLNFDTLSFSSEDNKPLGSLDLCEGFQVAQDGDTGLVISTAKSKLITRASDKATATMWYQALLRVQGLEPIAALCLELLEEPSLLSALHTVGDQDVLLYRSAILRRTWGQQGHFKDESWITFGVQIALSKEHLMKADHLRLCVADDKLRRAKCLASRRLKKIMKQHRPTLPHALWSRASLSEPETYENRYWKLDPQMNDLLQRLTLVPDVCISSEDIPSTKILPRITLAETGEIFSESTSGPAGEDSRMGGEESRDEAMTQEWKRRTASLDGLPCSTEAINAAASLAATMDELSGETPTANSVAGENGGDILSKVGWGWYDGISEENFSQRMKTFSKHEKIQDGINRRHSTSVLSRICSWPAHDAPSMDPRRGSGSAFSRIFETPVATPMKTVPEKAITKRNTLALMGPFSFNESSYQKLSPMNLESPQLRRPSATPTNTPMAFSSTLRLVPNTPLSTPRSLAEMFASPINSKSASPSLVVEIDTQAPRTSHSPSPSSSGNLSRHVRQPNSTAKPHPSYRPPKTATVDETLILPPSQYSDQYSPTTRGSRSWISKLRNKEQGPAERGLLLGPCGHVKPFGITWGQLAIDDASIVFVPFLCDGLGCLAHAAGTDPEDQSRRRAGDSDFSVVGDDESWWSWQNCAKRRLWKLSKLTQIHPRRYLLQPKAVELYFRRRAVFFTFQSAENRDDVIRIIEKKFKALARKEVSRCYSDAARQLSMEGIQYKWAHGEISNFEYLMTLNVFAGRTYNDLGQYFVFPWILADYSSRSLDLQSPQTFRDLSRPIGIQNSDNEKFFRQRFTDSADMISHNPQARPFHYGSHYSNPAYVLHYLIRMEPFTSMSLELQDGRFDHCDRMFNSVPQTYANCLATKTDHRELIPEFFYCSQFLENRNSVNFGVRASDKERMDHVTLPPWARDAEEFILLHREALESDYVSENLHHWIDLIFGYKQSGTESINAFNVFHFMSYESYTQSHKLTAAEEVQIAEFGQIPLQLFSSPHPSRSELRRTGTIPSPVSSSLFQRESRRVSSPSTSFASITNSISPKKGTSAPQTQAPENIQRYDLNGLLNEGVVPCAIFSTEHQVIVVANDNSFYTFDWKPLCPDAASGTPFSISLDEVSQKRSSDAGIIPSHQATHYPSPTSTPRERTSSMGQRSSLTISAPKSVGSEFAAAAAAAFFDIEIDSTPLKTVPQSPRTPSANPVLSKKTPAGPLSFMRRLGSFSRPALLGAQKSLACGQSQAGLVNSQRWVVIRESFLDNVLISCGHWDRSIHFVSVRTKALVSAVRSSTDISTCLATVKSHDIIVAGCKDGTIHVWRLTGSATVPGSVPNAKAQASLQQIVIPAHSGSVLLISASEAVDTIVSYSESDRTMGFHSLSRVKSLHYISPPPHKSVSQMVLSEKGDLIVILRAEADTSWSSPETQLARYCLTAKLRKIETASEEPNAMVISPEEEFIVTGGYQGVVVRDLMTLTPKYSFDLSPTSPAPSLPLSVVSLCFSADRNHLFVGMSDGRVGVYTSTDNTTNVMSAMFSDFNVH